MCILKFKFHKNHKTPTKLQPTIKIISFLPGILSWCGRSSGNILISVVRFGKYFGTIWPASMYQGLSLSSGMLISLWPSGLTRSRDTDRRYSSIVVWCIWWYMNIYNLLRMGQAVSQERIIQLLEILPNLGIIGADLEVPWLIIFDSVAFCVVWASVEVGWRDGSSLLVSSSASFRALEMLRIALFPFNDWLSYEVWDWISIHLGVW